MTMTTTKRYLFAALALCLSLTIYGQSQTQAKKWFVAGEYAKAKPVFAKLIKSNPKSGSLNYWYGVCLNETGEHDKALPYLKKAVENDVENAYRYIGDYYLADNKHEDALKHYDLYLERVDPTDTLFVVYTRLAEKVKHELKFYKRVEKVIFVDSLIVAKESLLTSYSLGPESGNIGTTKDMVGSTKGKDCTAFRTEMRDKIYYSDMNAEGDLQLYMSYKMLDNWSHPSPLNGLPEGNNNYPYMLSDGVTFYFANNNPSGVGGYDLYVTRYNPDTDRFLVAENLGMPFNSSANDYMMAIDEVNNLGWFATDRNQPADSVCIYIFIPTTEKQYHTYSQAAFTDIAKAASIHSIVATQTNAEAVKKAKQTLFKLKLSLQQKEKERDFTFIIDDFTDYHSLDDFKNPEARQLYISWGDKQKQLQTLGKQLEEKRTRYTQSSSSERRMMTNDLLHMEQVYEKLEREVIEMPINIRNIEINYIKR